MRLCRFDDELFEEIDEYSAKEGIDGFLYLKHVIELWPVEWDDHLKMMN